MLNIFHKLSKKNKLNMFQLKELLKEPNIIQLKNKMLFNKYIFLYNILAYWILRINICFIIIYITNCYIIKGSYLITNCLILIKRSFLIITSCYIIILINNIITNCYIIILIKRSNFITNLILIISIWIIYLINNIITNNLINNYLTTII